MRVLFVPNRGGPFSHGIPLLALSERLPANRYPRSFLLPSSAHQFFRTAGANVLDIHHEGLRTEMIAYQRFKPDVVVDDFSLSTGVASGLVRLPRVTIQRTGSFPSSLRSNPTHHFSGNLDLASITDFTKLGLEQPHSIADLLQAEAVIVPGIERIEVLPDLLKCDRQKYFYAGPLLTKDYFITSVGQLQPNFRIVEDFLAAHASHQVLYVTFGNIARPHQAVRDGIKKLLMAGQPIISNIELTGTDRLEENYLFARYLPMHLVCSRATLIAHHCGSGTYQYPILHQKPFITVGTGTFDRDDIAIRLQRLGAGPYIPNPTECSEFEDQFVETIRSFLIESADEPSPSRRVLAELREEFMSTSQSFRFQDVLEFAASGASLHRSG